MSTFVVLLAAGCGGGSGTSALKAGVASLQDGQYERAAGQLKKGIERKPEGVRLDKAHNLLGIAYWRSERPDEAARAFEMSRNLNPDFFEATYNLGALYAGQDKRNEAATHLREAALMNPDDTRALEMLASMYMQEGKFEEAHQVLLQAQERDNSSPRILTSLAVAGLHRSDGGAMYAVSYLEQAKKAEPGYAPALFNLGVIYDRYRKDPESAVSFYNQYLLADSHEERGTRVKSAIGRLKGGSVAAKPPLGGTPAPAPAPEPEHPVASRVVALLNQARSEVRNGADDKALNLCLMAANAAMREGHGALQERALLSAVSLCPGQAKSHYAYGRFLKDKNRCDESMKSFRTALELHPGWATALNGLAEAAIICSDFETARKALKQAVDADPGDADSLWALALFYDTQLQMADRAKVSFRKFIDTFPADTRAKDAAERLRKLSDNATAPERMLRHEFIAATQMGNARGDAPAPAVVGGNAPPLPQVSITPRENRVQAVRLYNRGTERLENGDPAGALEMYRQAARRDPNFAAPLYNMGIVLQQQGEASTARKAYEQALKIDPDLVNARYHLGLLFQKQTRLDDALRELNLVVKADANHASAHYALGQVHAAKEGLHDARVHFGRFLELAPNHPAVPGVRHWLLGH